MSKRRKILFEDDGADLEGLLDLATLDDIQELRAALMRHQPCGELESQVLAILERRALAGGLTRAELTYDPGAPIPSLPEVFFGLKFIPSRVEQWPDPLPPLTRIEVSYRPFDPYLDANQFQKQEENDYVPGLGLNDDWPEPVPEPANIWLQGRRAARAKPQSKLPDHMRRLRRGPERRSHSF